MDGNGRWARARHLPRTAGHKRGVESTRRVIEGCARRGIEALTLFAFSSENWRRPKEEVSTLMELFLVALRREIRALHENGVRLRFIGDRSAFDDRLRRQIDESEALTADNKGLQLQVAANYGGRWDILQASRRLAEAVARGEIRAADIDESAFSFRLSTHGLPEPDLFIRTGGEQRISNFLLWQVAYAELWFTPVLWPDFDDEQLQLALDDFARRQRRFGMTGEQVEPQHA
ncbi:MAG TPA: di-trans,poly-cis-decaprenylcistransferase [Thiotrichales bacterium]|nr:di-trans,poly-cis-decaprenylcistransferase [Thiotrichales bacterium]